MKIVCKRKQRTKQNISDSSALPNVRSDDRQSVVTYYKKQITQFFTDLIMQSREGTVRKKPLGKEEDFSGWAEWNAIRSEWMAIKPWFDDDEGSTATQTDKSSLVRTEFKVPFVVTREWIVRHGIKKKLSGRFFSRNRRRVYERERDRDQL